MSPWLLHLVSLTPVGVLPAAGGILDPRTTIMMSHVVLEHCPGGVYCAPKEGYRLLWLPLSGGSHFLRPSVEPRLSVPAIELG
jgi:hypothetical protein